MVVAAAVATALIHAVVNPVLPAPDGLFRVSVTGVHAPAADVVVHGGIASGGKMFGLVPLRDRGGGTWFTVLRAPGFLGTYPIRVRYEGRYHETDALVSILPKNFDRLFSGATPEAVLLTWRVNSPGGATIASSTTWKQGFYYHRDQRYNRLLRVKFTLVRPWPRYHLQAGTFVKWFDLVRTSTTAKWHLVQVVDAP